MERRGWGGGRETGKQWSKTNRGCPVSTSTTRLRNKELGDIEILCDGERTLGYVCEGERIRVR